METISVVITDSSDMRCFDLYLYINAEISTQRNIDIMFKLTLHCLSKFKYNEDTDMKIYKYFRYTLFRSPQC